MEIEQAFRLGCTFMINQIAFTDGFSEDQYEWLLEIYETNCTLQEEL